METQTQTSLLTLRRMASRLGVTAKWLKEQAESGKVPALKADRRWLFNSDVVIAVVADLAKGVQHAP